ncbi:uncharacterized protein A4U43_C02F7980 [Asparagus officinalis]|uniref:Protein BIC1 n=1 Tax=Asparagus officinalis TaxID=4686 RepID=A0A5P1FLW3_ASPOF|nr:uncharacterized protein LOC109829436 [Asparagus officinalis]ONK77570.1 uncharacterized protein A4U43_C02F7980 [Asparagus officinalis]
MATDRDLEGYEPNSSILSVSEARMEDSGSQIEPTEPRVLEITTTATTTTNEVVVPSVQNLPIFEENSARKRSNQDRRAAASPPPPMITTDRDLEREEQNLSINSGDVTGRERLRRHRAEMAGKVRIPEIWGQERLLKDWVDCSAIDRCLVPKGVVSARKALVEECRRANSAGLRIENWC